MESKWLSYQSFSNDQDLIKTINNLIFYLSDRAAGKQSLFSESDFSQNKEDVLEFLDDFLNSVDCLERDGESKLLFNKGPRYFSLVESFRTAKKKRKLKSKVFTNTIDRITELFNSKIEGELEELIKALSEFRSLVEEHRAKDSRSLFPSI